jgi:hypothetical protein
MLFKISHIRTNLSRTIFSGSPNCVRHRQVVVVLRYLKIYMCIGKIVVVNKLSVFNYSELAVRFVLRTSQIWAYNHLPTATTKLRSHFQFSKHNASSEQRPQIKGYRWRSLYTGLTVHEILLRYIRFNCNFIVTNAKFWFLKSLFIFFATSPSHVILTRQILLRTLNFPVPVKNNDSGKFFTLLFSIISCRI